MPNIGDIRGLLFDKDGTILDFYPTWVPINRDMAFEAAGGDPELFRRLLLDGGHDPDTDLIEPASALSGAGVEGIVDCFAATLGPACPANLRDIVAKNFREGGAKYAVLVDGAAETISELASRGFQLGVATNDTIDGLQASLARCGDIGRYFPYRAGCDSGFGSKPEPGMGVAFAEATRLRPVNCAMIGDTLHDIEMGRRAGFGLCVGVLTGASKRFDLEPYRDVVFDSIREMPDWLRARI